MDYVFNEYLIKILINCSVRLYVVFKGGYMLDSIGP